MYGKNLIVYAIIFLICPQFSYGRKYRVVGGRDPKVDEVKYIVAVLSTTWICGGGIIGERFVLTAAHCLNVDMNTSKLLKPIRIVAGTNFTSNYNKSEVIEIDVEEAYLPTVHVKNGPHDIAVLKLKESLDFMKYHNKVEKLSLPKPLTEDPLSYPTYENVSVKLAGYGDSQALVFIKQGKLVIMRSGVGRLQVANALINDAITCKKYYPDDRNDQMCISVLEDTTKMMKQGTCAGDSGSPAVYGDSIIIGFVTTGRAGCNNNFAPTLLTRVSSYIPFIQQVMSGNLSGLVVYDA